MGYPEGGIVVKAAIGDQSMQMGIEVLKIAKTLDDNGRAGFGAVMGYEDVWAMYREVTSNIPGRGNLVQVARMAAVLLQNGNRKKNNKRRPESIFTIPDKPYWVENYGNIYYIMHLCCGFS